MKYSILLIAILSGFIFVTYTGDCKPGRKEKSMFGLSGNSKAYESEWITLNSVDQITEIISASKETPVLIYKHSTACGLNARVKADLEKDWDEIKNKVSLYYLDLLAYRNVSNEVARIFNVIHQSPQLILVVDGHVVKSWSHIDVRVEAVLEEI